MRLVQLKSCASAHSALRHSASERRALRSSSLSRGLWPSRCMHSVAPGSVSKLHGGPQPHRISPPRSVAPCAARRCVAGLGRPATCRASSLIQLKAARRPTAASRHSTSERRVLRSSPLRCGPWPSCCVQSVAPSSAPSCTAAHSRLVSLHFGASRVAQLAAAPRALAVPQRAWRSAWSAQSCTAAHSRLEPLHLGASRVA